MKNECRFDVEDVFNAEDYLYFYGQVLTAERLKDELDFLAQHTNLQGSLKVLDLACGHGRHANQLARLGHNVTGIDLTEGFLEIAEREAKKLGVFVDYIHEDMRKIDYSEEFDRIYSLFTALGYFSDEENFLLFRKVYQALKPGGVFCFDSHNRDAFLTYFQPSTVVEKEENLMIDQCRFDTFTGRCKTKRMTIKNGDRKTFEFSMRLYNPTEIVQLFEQIGFSACSFYEGWSGAELTPQSRRMVVVAKK